MGHADALLGGEPMGLISYLTAVYDKFPCHTWICIPLYKGYPYLTHSVIVHGSYSYKDNPGWEKVFPLKKD
jgi:hypothetical protein